MAKTQSEQSLPAQATHYGRGGYPALLSGRERSMNRAGGGSDNFDHLIRMREHRDVAAGKLRRCGAHPLGNEPFHVGVNGAVVFADDVPARL